MMMNILLSTNMQNYTQIPLYRIYWDSRRQHWLEYNLENYASITEILVHCELLCLFYMT